MKKVTKNCWGCKRFEATAIAVPPPGPLPTNRTEGTTAFKVAGVDFSQVQCAIVRGVTEKGRLTSPCLPAV